MSLSHEHVGSKIPAKINTFMLTRAELLIHLCYEIPCTYTGSFLKENKIIFRLLIYYLPTQSMTHFTHLNQMSKLSAH